MSRQITPPERAPLHECARWLSLDYQWLYGKVRGGEIPAENHGTDLRAKWWIRTADLMDYLETRRAS
jgi:hypothetical protein